MIQTSRLEFVPFDKKYAVDLFELWSDYEVVKYTYMPLIHTMEECQDKIDMFIEYTDDTFINNFILLYHKKAIGIIGSPVKDLINQKFGLYYQLARNYWGQGFITEAVDAYWQYLKNEFPHMEVNAEVIPQNTASAAILKRLGFECTERMKGGFIKDSFKCDLEKYVYRSKSSNLRGDNE